MFEDLIAANRLYADDFHLAGLPAKAARQLAVVTCIDSRIEPLAMLGLAPGDAKILRNAGGRVTEDVLRSLTIATSLLSVTRIAVIHHTACALITGPADLTAAIARAVEAEPPPLDWRTITDPDADLASDVEAIRRAPAIAAAVVGMRYDISTGLLSEVVT
jgi:carbonic anhydrase